MSPSAPILVALADASAQRRRAAQDLAERLDCALFAAPPDQPGPALVFTAERIELRDLGAGADAGAVYCDFVHGANAHRQRYGGGRGQALARACGVKPGVTPTVIDATAGLGRDAWVLATLGCEVIALERHPCVHALLRDGLERALEASAGRDIAARIQLHHADAVSWLAQPVRADTIFLDPMFPARDKSAAVKKDLALLQRLVHAETNDAAALLAAARAHGAKRIAVKRPVRAKPLADAAPQGTISGKTVRYDLYTSTATPA